MCVVQYECMQTAPTDRQWFLPISIFAGLNFALFSFSTKYAKIKPPRKKGALQYVFSNGILNENLSKLKMFKKYLCFFLSVSQDAGSKMSKMKLQAKAKSVKAKKEADASEKGVINTMSI